jgi:cell cycle sensor histidine kinase DivJ
VRTPLNAIIGFSDMLSNPQMGPIAEETVREYARIINQGGHQLLHLVTGTIDLIRLDSGTNELNAEGFAPADLIDCCIEAVSEAAEAKVVRIVRHLPPFLPDLTSDRRALGQALTQVISNAVKFSPDGSQVSVEVRARDGQLAMTISDNGAGMPPEHLARMGDPFFQGDGSYGRAVSGAGMGLALAKRLLDVLGGKLAVESRLGIGTRVSIEVPLAFGTEAKAPVPESGAVARIERRPQPECLEKRRTA